MRTSWREDMENFAAGSPFYLPCSMFIYAMWWILSHYEIAGFSAAFCVYTQFELLKSTKTEGMKNLEVKLIG